MTAKRNRQRIRNYLATIGWSADDIATMLSHPTRQAIERLEDLLVESSEARRKLSEARAYFPNVKLLDVKSI